MREGRGCHAFHKRRAVPASVAVVKVEGLAFGGQLFGRAMDLGDKIGCEIAVKSCNKLTELEPAEIQRWKSTAATVETDWVNEMKSEGIDSTKLATEARVLAAKRAK